MIVQNLPSSLEYHQQAIASQSIFMDFSLEAAVRRDRYAWCEFIYLPIVIKGSRNIACSLA
jgi:hypothetical protein